MQVIFRWYGTLRIALRFAFSITTLLLQSRWRIKLLLKSLLKWHESSMLACSFFIRWLSVTTRQYRVTVGMYYAWQENINCLWSINNTFHWLYTLFKPMVTVSCMECCDQWIFNNCSQFTHPVNSDRVISPRWSEILHLPVTWTPDNLPICPPSYNGSIYRSILQRICSRDAGDI